MAKVKKIGRFNVRIVLKGDKYGLEDCLTHKEKKPLVEFYDTKHMGKGFSRYGQFVSRYYAQTLIDDFDKVTRNGLALVGYEPAWSVSPEDMVKVIKFMFQTLTE